MKMRWVGEEEGVLDLPTGSYKYCSIKLTNTGLPHPGQVLAVKLLQRELARIAASALPQHKVTLDLQKPRGSFNLQFVDGLTHRSGS